MPISRMFHLSDSLKSLQDTAVYNATFRKMIAAGLMGYERLFLGKTMTNEIGLFIQDNKGRPRIKIGLDEQNNVIFHALDTNGLVIPLKQ